MKRIKVIIDILMYVIFIVLMGHHITENFLHEILGTIIFILFIIHHILNYRYYKSIFKGKYTTRRKIILVLDLLLFISMVGMMVSAINISSDVFAWLHIPSKIWGRKFHMLSTSWGFIFMSIHVGLHLNRIIRKLKQFKYICYLIIGYGIYNFIKLDFISDMFLLNAFKYYDFSIPSSVFYLRVLTSSLSIGIITNFIIERGKRNE